MVINALAAPAKPLPAETLRRFINTSRSYLGQSKALQPGRPDGGEFVDPPRFRLAQQVQAGGAQHA